MSRKKKKKVDKLDSIKLKNISVSKNLMRKVKRQSTGWEKIFRNHRSDKGLVSRIYKEFF